MNTEFESLALLHHLRANCPTLQQIADDRRDAAIMLRLGYSRASGLPIARRLALVQLHKAS